MDVIEYYKDRAGQWRWRLLSKNGRVVADGSEGYATRSSVRRAVKRLLLSTPLRVQQRVSDKSVVIDDTLTSLIKEK